MNGSLDLPSVRCRPSSRLRIVSTVHLYDLSQDPVGERDLAAAHPEVLAELTVRMAKDTD